MPAARHAMPRALLTAAALWCLLCSDASCAPVTTGNMSTSTAAVSTTAVPPATLTAAPTLAPETPVAPPFGETTPPPTLSVAENLELLFLHHSFSWSDINQYRQRIINKWWVAIFALPFALSLCVGIAKAQTWVAYSGTPNLRLFTSYLSRNICAATIVGGTLALMSYMQSDDARSAVTVGVDATTGSAQQELSVDTSVRWSLLTAWSYHTVFIFTLIYSFFVVLIYYSLTKTVLKWIDWESTLPRNPKAPHAESYVSLDLNLMLLVRELFYHQLLLVFPNADFERKYGVHVTKYLAIKQREMVKEISSFSSRSDWIVMAIFVLVNGLRVQTISSGATEVTDLMRLQDGLTFAFALGAFPLLCFYGVYRMLIRGLWRFLRSATANVKRRLARRERAKARGAFIDHSNGDPLYIDVSVLPMLPDPAAFVPLRSTHAVTALWRAAVVLNSLYLAVLIMALSHSLVTQVAGGPALLVCCLIPSVVLVQILPWSTAAIVVVRYLGRNTDVQEALRSFTDVEWEQERKIEMRDERRGPTRVFDEGDAEDSVPADDVVELQLLEGARASLETVNRLQQWVQDTANNRTPPTSGGRAGKAKSKQAAAAAASAAPLGGSSTAPSVVGALSQTPVVPLAMSSQLTEQYQRNMHIVNERILELKEQEGRLHTAVIRASFRRRRTQRRLESLVECVGRRTDLSHFWRTSLEKARARAEEVKSLYRSDFDVRIADLQSRQANEISRMGGDAKDFSLHDVFAEELATLEADRELHEKYYDHRVPSLHEVYSAFAPTDIEMQPKLPPRRYEQLTEEHDAAKRWLDECTDVTYSAAQRLRRRALRNSLRSAVFNEAELERLAALGVARREIDAWAADLNDSSDDSDADDTSGTGRRTASGRRSPDSSATSEGTGLSGRDYPTRPVTALDVMQEQDWRYWGLTEEEVEAMKHPKEPVPLPHAFDFGDTLAQREAKKKLPPRQRQRTSAAAPGADDSQLPQGASSPDNSPQQNRTGAAPSGNGPIARPAAVSMGVTLGGTQEPSGNRAPSADPFETASLWTGASRGGRSRANDDDESDINSSSVGATSSYAPSVATSGGRSVARVLRHAPVDDPDL